MIAIAHDTREVCAAAADLFDYRRASDAPGIAKEIADALEPRHQPAAEALRNFAAETAEFSEAQREEVFARTYDLNPSCPPYLSVHLFGEESFKRAILMTGLAAAYDRAGFDRGSELPDHISVVLRFAPQFGAEEWDDLARFCLPTPLVRMSALLDPAKNPHRHVITALRAILKADFPTENLPCSTSSFSPRSLTSPCASCSSAPSGATGPTSSAIPRCHLNS
ncbi:MAG TPA: molecular chaperone TorD family protein [Candidatus Sumerlaeota bacterium]|nr:molecular chaperone TorD family protein [Candidatus Sumerlaeota bacterium]